MTDPTDGNPPSDTERHNAKMARKKQARDKIMATKTDEKGLVIVHTGKGKGKSSAAFGMISAASRMAFPVPSSSSSRAAWIPASGTS